MTLETAVTDRGTPWPGKGIQSRMRPANADALSAAGVDVAVLANNHRANYDLERVVGDVLVTGVLVVHSRNRHR